MRSHADSRQTGCHRPATAGVRMALDTPLDPPEPRWPAVIAVLAVGGIYLALPASLAVGPRWLEPVIVLLLTVPTVITYRRGHHALNHILGHSLAAVITLFM